MSWFNRQKSSIYSIDAIGHLIQDNLPDERANPGESTEDFVHRVVRWLINERLKSAALNALTPTEATRRLQSMVEAVWKKLEFMVTNLNYLCTGRTEQDLNVALESLSCELRTAKKLGGTNHHKIGVEVVDMLNRVSPGWDNDMKDPEMRPWRAAMTVMHLKTNESTSIKAWEAIKELLDAKAPKWREYNMATTNLGERAAHAIEQALQPSRPAVAVDWQKPTIFKAREDVSEIEITYLVQDEPKVNGEWTQRRQNLSMAPGVDNEMLYVKHLERFVNLTTMRRDLKAKYGASDEMIEQMIVSLRTLS